MTLFQFDLATVLTLCKIMQLEYLCKIAKTNYFNHQTNRTATGLALQNATFDIFSIRVV